MAAFYSPTLNFLYVCALVVYFLMNTWLCNESHCTRFVSLTSQACEGSSPQVLLRHRFCVPLFQESRGRSDRESGTKLNSQRQIFTLLEFFFFKSFSLQREVRAEHAKFAIQAVK